MHPIVKINQHTTVRAVVYPLCINCYQPYAWHTPNNRLGVAGCIGYWPYRPIEDFGTRAVDSGDWMIRLLWRAEKWLQRHREQRLRKLGKLR